LPGYSIEEQVFDGHYRVVKIDTATARLYTIDVYKRLSSEPDSCDNEIILAGTRLCYKKITNNCEAVILVTPGRVELVNLRLHATPQRDPAGGDPARARTYCLEALQSWRG